MAGTVIKKKFDVKQIALGAIALSVVIMLPKIGDAVSSALGTVLEIHGKDYLLQIILRRNILPTINNKENPVGIEIGKTSRTT